jgi:hypothetical protein
VNIHTILLLIGAILMLVASVASVSVVNLWYLGWALVVLAFVFGGS